jgi:hypothetical protein
MSFLCPDCLTAGTLKIISRLELPPDSRSDEITLQIVRCYHCRFQGIYYVGEADLQNLRRLIEQCPNPGDSRCTCSVHQRLGSKDGNGRWSGIADIDLGQSFLMRID